MIEEFEEFESMLEDAVPGYGYSESDPLVEYYYDPEHGIWYPEARELARILGKELPIVHIMTAMEFVQARKQGPVVGLDIAKITEDGILFTVEDKSKRGEKKGKKYYPGVYITFFDPLHRQQTEVCLVYPGR